MTTKMPDLPEPFRIYQYRSAGQRIPEYVPLMNKPIVPVFTADQMRDYAARHACVEIARLQAQVDALANALERAKRTMADYGQCDNDNWPCFQAVCAALAAVGR